MKIWKMWDNGFEQNIQHHSAVIHWEGSLSWIVCNVTKGGKLPHHRLLKQSTLQLSSKERKSQREIRTFSVKSMLLAPIVLKPMTSLVDIFTWCNSSQRPNSRFFESCFFAGKIKALCLKQRHWHTLGRWSWFSKFYRNMNWIGNKWESQYILVIMK